MEILNSGKSLILNVDNTPIMLLRNNAFVESTFTIHPETNPVFFRTRTFLYRITLEQLKVISNAKDVEIEIFSDINYYKGKLLQEDINRFKIFLNKYGNVR